MVFKRVNLYSFERIFVMEKKNHWKIMVTDYIEDDLAWEKAQFEKIPEIHFEAYQLKHAPEHQVIEKVRDADIIVVNMVQFNHSIIQSLERCQLIIRHGVGYDNVNVAELTKRGIIFINIPDYCVEEVAEQTVMHLFNCARKFTFQQQAMRQSLERGEWQFEAVYPVHQLSNSTLGIVGCGRIGSMVYRMMQGFQMKYLICDPYLTHERKTRLGIETIPLEKVLKESDFVTIHTPLNEETHHLISERELRMMKPTVFIINTARGGILDESAMIKACQEGWIAGAAIDVYEYREPPHKKSKLLEVKNINLTPHLAWYSVEAEWKIREKVIKNINRMIAGKLPNNIINPEVISQIEH
jgi:D-3-phosphoglycerate dehydrogenase